MATPKKKISRKRFSITERSETVAKIRAYRAEHPGATIAASVDALNMREHPGLKNARQWMSRGGATHDIKLPISSAIPLDAIPARPAKAKKPARKAPTEIEQRAAADAALLRQVDRLPPHYAFAVELLEYALRILRRDV